jgi:hypothetical protein
MAHRHFGLSTGRAVHPAPTLPRFTASSHPPPCDEDREGAAGALPAARQPQLSSWWPIASAPLQKTVFLGRYGEKLRVAGRRLSPAGHWHHAHSGDTVCFEPTCWTSLPSAPLAAARYVLDPGAEHPRRDPPLWTLAGPEAWPRPPRRHDLTAVIAALVLLGLIAVSLAGSCRFGLFGLCRDHAIHVWTTEHVIT